MCAGCSCPVLSSPLAITRVKKNSKTEILEIDDMVEDYYKKVKG